MPDELDNIVPQDDPESVTRRRFLTGAAAAGVSLPAAAALTSCSTSGGSSSAASNPAAGPIDASLVSFDGTHQAGITTPAPAYAIVAAFDTVATSREQLQGVFRTLTDTARSILAGPLPAAGAAVYPPTDNGVLGPDPEPDHLTITVGVGSSLFDARFGLSARKPVKLVQMPRFHNDDLDPARVHGDLVIQICADHEDTCLRALRLLAKNTRGSLTVRWLQDGFQRPNTSGPGTTSTRNLLGFKDGTANPSTTDDALMDELVWVAPGGSEPAWASGGSYLVVRMIRMLVERWDRTSLSEQENIIGRHKDSGAPLGQNGEADTPAFATDAANTRTPVDAHIRLANPRTPETANQRILRRGFSFSNGFDSAGQLDQGLLFVAYQQDVERGFATVQQRLDKEPLEEYIKPVGGGYFFALPGVDEHQYLGQTLLEG
jgi:deferrochelatase/peroxidase EfeB